MIKKLAFLAVCFGFAGHLMADLSPEQQEKWKKFEEDMKGYAEAMNTACGFTINYDAKPEWFAKSIDKDIASMFWSATEAITKVCSSGYQDRLKRKLANITFKPGEKTAYNVKGMTFDYVADLDQKENNAAETSTEIEKFLKAKLNN